MVKWSNPEKGVAPPLYLGVVPFEKWAFRSPSATVACFSFTYVYIHSHPQTHCFLVSQLFSVAIYIYIYKLEESKKRDEYQDLVTELKDPYVMKMMMIPTVIGALSTVTKGLVKGLEDLKVRGRVETIQTTALLRSARILRRVLETWGDLLSIRL